jgi:hypothetical protein
MPNETLRYPHRAPWCFRADQMRPCVRWWNRTTASKPSSINIVKVAWEKRYWPHLWVRCLSRGGPGGHCRYLADQVPLRTRLKSSPTAPDLAPSIGGLRHRHVPHDTGLASRQERATVSPRVPRFQTRLPVREGSGVMACPVAPGPPPGRGELWCRHVSHISRPAT